MQMKVHPAAELFPLLEADDFDALVQSIKMFGQQVPCVRDGDLIIDGRNRHRACQELGIETKWVEWRDVVKERPFEYSGEGELLASDYIWSLNFDRRHLTDDQMAMLWGKFKPIATAEAEARKKAGGEKGRQAQAEARKSGCGTIGPTASAKPKLKPKRARTEVAQKLGVSERKLKAAAKVIEKAPELVAKVQKGEMTLKEATDALPKPKKQAKQLTTEQRFYKWWPKCLQRFPADELPEIKQLIAKEIQ